MFCSLCGQHARHAKSPVPDLRRKTCPRFSGGAIRGASDGRECAVVHRGCCALEPCSEIDARGQVRCMWEHGGRERLIEFARVSTDAAAARARYGAIEMPRLAESTEE